MQTIHPLSRGTLAYNCLVTIVDATYTAFIVPIGIAFQYDAKHFSWYNAIDIAAGATAMPLAKCTIPLISIHHTPASSIWLPGLCM